MKGQPLIPLALIAGVGICLMLVFSFIGLGAGGEEGEEGNENGEEMDTDDPVALGEQLFEDSCLSCHGDAGAGGTAGPPVAGLDMDVVIQAIEEGPGAMPDGLVSGEEAEAVAEYVSSLE
ncbi:cytochrome c [Geomicrobium sp. JCM 19039]|uniref:c-type cytochrome n=1 Tax=Geomicrobium sp. JCM 19039 TaxID=1460636 RepID=UPI00045F1C41|nr:cytochrome c [Geomicrobium sp. JCM 19039]GAK11478.1 membrane-attached cytochrome c550 [Geomicrobium sp. JCM 19039]